MVFQTHRALARLSHFSLQCLDKPGLTALGFNLTRVALRRPYLGPHEATDTFRPAFQTPPLCRSYAKDAVSRPKAHTGRTATAPRKKASTARSTAPATGLESGAATSNPVAKKTKSKAKTKPKPRTKAKSTKARKKSPKAKAKPAKKKKALKPEEKERLLVKELKAKALSPPKRLATSAFTVLFVEKQRELKASESAASITKECSKIYRSFTPEQREHYNHIANENKASYDSTYRNWILSHSPMVILEANAARVALKKRMMSPKTKLHDERLVKRPRNAFSKFSVQRHLSRDFAGMKLGEAAKLISAEWRAMSENDKKPFLQERDEDLARYVQEVKAVYNRDVKLGATKA
ncbi:MAG: hypothetical protein LQ339_003030 [Xanthoria mediterranea]|nr:MAG: hypothetical protein LQ339_003030 [Xanthoria mediterranea]